MAKRKVQMVLDGSAEAIIGELRGSMGGVSMSEAIREALSLAHWVLRSEKKGCSVVAVHPDGKMVQVATRFQTHRETEG